MKPPQASFFVAIALTLSLMGCARPTKVTPTPSSEKSAAKPLTGGQKMLQAVIAGQMDALDYEFTSDPIVREDAWPATLTGSEKEAVVKSALKVMRDRSKKDLLRLNAGILVVGYSSDPQLIKEGKTVVEYIGRDYGPFTKDGFQTYGAAVSFLARICQTGDKLLWASSVPFGGTSRFDTWLVILRTYTEHPKALEESLAILGVKESEDGVRVTKLINAKGEFEPEILALEGFVEIEELIALRDAIRKHEEKTGESLSRATAVVSRAITLELGRNPSDI